MLAATDELLTAQEVGERLGVHERTVRRWIEAGRLPAAKTGSSFAIRVEDVEALAGQSVRLKALPRLAERDRDAEHIELQGRYKQLSEMFERLEAELADERRRSARLEIQLESRAA